MNRASLTGFRLTAWLLPLCAAASALAQDEGAFDRTPQDCVITSRIDQTDAIDDQNIIFRMRGDQVYRNTLPRKCPGLERENRIAYESVSSRLCNIDTITVLEDFGVGFRPGFTCRLGEFVPLSPAEVEDLDLRKRGVEGQSTIETSEVELDGDDDAAESEEDEAAADADTDVRGRATQGAVAEGSPDVPAAEPAGEASAEN
jgi:Family of unknown function (DUF6491)